MADRLARLRRPILVAADNDAAGRNARDHLTALLTERGAAVAAIPIPGRHNDLNDWHVANRDRWPTTLTAAIKITMSGTGPRPPSTGLTGIA